MQLLASFIRDHRKLQQLTLDQVVENSDNRISKAYISKLENNKIKRISLDMLVALAEGLSVDPHRLLDIYLGKGHGRNFDRTAQRNRMEPESS
jgi:transcriptional regulator with XRE-family HTH domain